MKIVIIGAGAVGFELARTISRREHDVWLVERDAEVLDKASEQLDCRFVAGNGVSPGTLRDVGMRDCDLFAAVTDRDEVNIIACQTAHALGAGIKVARVRSDEYYEGHRLLLDGVDLNLLLGHWGDSVNMSGMSGPTQTPEPATLSLLAVGGLAILRRRRQK